jgi:uncharacterized SAM-binding protein YcdF (DUF218 family)
VDAFLALKYLAQLATPPGLLAAGLVLGALLSAVGLRRLGRFLAAVGIAQAILMSLSPVSDALMVPLENEARRLAAQAPPCCYDSIVVLGGAVKRAMPPARPTPDLADGADRVWHAARLFKLGVAPRGHLSGGAPDAAAELSEAVAMRAFLVDLGVPTDRIVLETRSLNTIGNVREVRAIVGNQRVALVTSAYHMPRAMHLAKLGRLNASAFPTDWQAVADDRAPWIAWLPSVDSMLTSWMALKEHIALNFDMREGDLKP